jgi:RNA polymerase primary sigma factor
MKPQPKDKRSRNRSKQAARGRVSSGVRAAEPGRRQLLTREEEVAHAKSIESAERALLEAIAGSAPALEKLAAICDEVRGGTLELSDLLRDSTDAEHAPLGVVTAILDAAHALTEARRPGRHTEDFVQTVLPHRLSPKAISAILRKLDAGARNGAPASAATAAAVRRAQERAEQARSALTQANLGLVIWMVRRRGPQGFSTSDLVQEGNLGLMRAVEKFDYRRGFRFNTYASWWIRHYMNRALSDQSRVIRLPVHLLEARHRILRRAQDFRQRQGREPTVRELADATDLPVEKVADILRIPPQPSSLDAPIGPDGDARRGDLVADERAASPADAISAKQIQGRLRQMLQSLTPREQEVLSHRFGMNGAEGVTLQQIGERFSLSRERVRQIESQALAKLRKQAEAENLDSDLSA